MGKAQSLTQLLQENDVAFIASAYQFILGRPVDPTGLELFTHRIRAGMPKAELINNLARSSEGRASRAPRKGLRVFLRRYQLSRIPVFGWFARRMYGLEGNSPIERQLRVLACELHRIRTSLDQHDVILKSLAHDSGHATGGNQLPVGSAPVHLPQFTSRAAEILDILQSARRHARSN